MISGSFGIDAQLASEHGHWLLAARRCSAARLPCCSPEYCAVVQGVAASSSCTMLGLRLECRRHRLALCITPLNKCTKIMTWRRCHLLICRRIAAFNMQHFAMTIIYKTCYTTVAKRHLDMRRMNSCNKVTEIALVTSL